MVGFLQFFSSRCCFFWNFVLFFFGKGQLKYFTKFFNDFLRLIGFLYQSGKFIFSFLRSFSGFVKIYKCVSTVNQLFNCLSMFGIKDVDHSFEATECCWASCFLQVVFQSIHSTHGSGLQAGSPWPWHRCWWGPGCVRVEICIFEKALANYWIHPSETRGSRNFRKLSTGIVGVWQGLQSFNNCLPSGHHWSNLKNFGHFWATLDSIELYLTISNNFGSFWNTVTSLDYFGQLWNTVDHFGPL